MKHIKTLIVVGLIGIFGTALAYLPGDINKDNVVDSVDLDILTAAYNSNPLSLNWNADADINSDGVVDFADLTLLSQNYGSTSTPEVTHEKGHGGSSNSSGSCLHYWPEDMGGGVTPCYLEWGLSF